MVGELGFRHDLLEEPAIMRKHLWASFDGRSRDLKLAADTQDHDQKDVNDGATDDEFHQGTVIVSMAASPSKMEVALPDV